MSEVETGPSDSTLTVVRQGLVDGDVVIPQPSDAIGDGTRVGVLRQVRP